jgi:CubicO group peptidase (beta-lactamase class C family)
MGGEPASLWMDREQGMPKTFGFLLATPRSWIQLGRLFLNEGRVGDRQVVPANWLVRMRQPSQHAADYGYPLYLGKAGPALAADRSEPFVVDDVLMIEGGQKQVLYMSPSKRVLILRVGEQPDDWDDSVVLNLYLRAAELTPIQ